MNLIKDAHWLKSTWRADITAELPDGYSITEAQKQKISHFGETKRIVAIHLRTYFPFLTDFEHLEKPEDVALIGFFDESIRNSMKAHHAKYFDEIFFGFKVKPGSY